MASPGTADAEVALGAHQREPEPPPQADFTAGENSRFMARDA